MLGSMIEMDGCGDGRGVLFRAIFLSRSRFGSTANVGGG
jgi:hypothetical protein